ncbi:LCP family protein [Sphaerisporangium fuscum]|uniref:LCP family protein n=1 Tax=Sphaerisporangium fuscum TaxID=2835868 RepID=UPI001BDC502B|nr:LCP family protein [Sphaerisporangium fuscum]
MKTESRGLGTGPAGAGWGDREPDRPPPGGEWAGSERPGLARVLALTAGSALLWGLAHLCTGRRTTGAALAGLYAALAAAVVASVTVSRSRLLTLLVHPWGPALLTAAAIVTGIAWSAVVLRSYRLLAPSGLGRWERGAARTVTTVLCAAVLAPPLYAAHLARVSHEVVTTLFASGPAMGADPWRGKERVNILLLGADAARNRPGARTDSMTVAAIDTRTGRTVLFSLPRNLQRVPMPKGPAREVFPDGFTGDGAGPAPALLNEVYQWGEEHPWIEPRLPERRRGAALLKQTIGGILGIPVDYYVMVDMKGFKEIIDATGGVTVTVKHDIPYGLEGGVLRAGTRRLSGEEALWFGRSRSDSDDYTRMGRQKCLLGAIAAQSDPVTVLRSFERLADAAKRYVFTDIPGESLPALVDLSKKMKNVPIESVQFVPPLINTAYPDWRLIKEKVAESIDAPRARPSRHIPGRNPGAEASQSPSSSTVTASCN